MESPYLEKLRNLTSGNLDPADFGHLDHVGVAYEALLRHDFFEAVSHVAAGLRRLAECAGAPGKFNATITWAFMSLIAERMRITEHRNAEEFIEGNPDLAFRTVLARWYSPERLKSDLARTTVLLPDTAPVAG